MFRKTHILKKKPNPLGFSGFIEFWALLGFPDFLVERTVEKLVS